MSSNSIRSLLIALLVLPLTALGGDRGLQPDPGSAGHKDIPPGQNFEGGRDWALIVGINYDKEVPEFKLGHLVNAENDARRVRDTLIHEFGYAPEQTFLLLGSGTGDEQATRERIEYYLKSVLGTRAPDAPPQRGPAGAELPPVGPKDSVLVFFAGHGLYRSELSQIEGYAGELVPAAVRLRKDGLPAPEGLLELGDVKNQLERSPALRKLLILDCCHSGQLFNLPFKQSILIAGPAADEASQKSKAAFWGMTSCQSREKAADRSKSSRTNSPFTSALIRQMRNLAGFNNSKPAFTARELLARIQVDFENENIRAQRPLGGPLVDRGGDFWLRPGKLTTQGLAFRRAEMPTPGNVAATLPGAHGDWWFDDTPWLIPSMRVAILARLKDRAASLTTLRKQELLLAARECAEAVPPGRGTIQALRREQLLALLDLHRAADRIKVLRDLATRLEELLEPAVQPGGDDVPANGMNVTAHDLHLLAVLRHRLEGLEGPAKDRPEPRHYYERACKKYADEEQAVSGGGKGAADPDALRALCLADWGQYEMTRGSVEKARDRFAEARALFPPEKRPQQFEVFLLCHEGATHRTLGNFDAARKRLQQAVDIAERVEKDGTLVAFSHEHSAWAAMATWKVEEARSHFTQAAKIRERFGTDLDSVILGLHNRQGLAMAHRYLGENGRAIAEYSQLMNDIRAIIERFEQEGDQHINHSADRERLYDRLANTAERLADALLLAERPDFAEAARYYGQVRGLRHRLPVDEAEATRLRIAYKLALCRSQSVEARDRSEAVALLVRSERDLEKGLKNRWVSNEEKEGLLLVRLVSSGLVALAELRDGALPRSGPRAANKRKPEPDTSEAAVKLLPAAEVFRRLCQESLPGRETDETVLTQPWQELVQEWINLRLNDRRLRQRLQRDDVELLMLAVRLMLQSSLQDAERQPPAVTERHPAEKAATLLVKLISLVQETAPRDTLAFLRPTFNLIVTARLEARRTDVKSLIDLTTNGRTGYPHTEVITRPTLAFWFFEPGRGVALLDIPHGSSRSHPIYDDANEAQKANRPLRLPASLQKELRLLQGEVDILWEDPVIQLTNASHAVAFDFCPQFPTLTFRSLSGPSWLQRPTALVESRKGK